MSVKTLESYQEFTADGSTTYFTFNFNYVDSSEIIVGMRTGDNQYTVVDPVNYVLTKNASTDGGKIRFVTTKPCENPDDPTCGDYIDNPPPAGTIVRIERKTVQSSTADWYVGLDMKALVSLFDKLFRITQENADKFNNTIQTFPTQQGITVRELLSEHDKKIFYWNNEKQWLDITDFTIDDVVRQTDVGDILEQANAYSDEQNAVLENRIDGKLTAVNAQIDANADAIQKTREDYINADSEIHQILNNHAENLTTLHNDVDDLGDQVSEIESKIPESASATNQLATKADLKDVDLDGYVKKSGDTMTGNLVIDINNDSEGVYFSDKHIGRTRAIYNMYGLRGLHFVERDSGGTPTMQFRMVDEYFDMPIGGRKLGTELNPWSITYTQKLNNGADLIVPTEGGTLARLEDVANKQDKLMAGDNIIISGNVISATGAGGGAGFDIVVVQELPATGQKGIIYLLAKDGTAPDVYDEYVWITATQTFELIGTTQVDLTDYIKNTDYATDAKAGIIRSSEDLATNVNTYGYLRASIQTLEQYNSASDSSFIGKRTLENIKEDLVARATENAVNTQNLTVGSGEGTLYIGDVAGTATIATNNGLDIVAKTKFDTAPTTDDNTTYANALDVSLMRKAQVATAIADAVSNIDALPDQTGNAGKVLTTDGSTASWQAPQGGGTKVIIKRYE